MVSLRGTSVGRIGQQRNGRIVRRGRFRLGDGPGRRFGQNPPSTGSRQAPGKADSALLSPDRLKQDGVAMKIEELPLAAGEPTDIDGLGRVDAQRHVRIGSVAYRLLAAAVLADGEVPSKS